MWGQKAFAFKEASGIEYGGEGQLDKETAKAFMDELDNGIIEEKV